MKGYIKLFRQLKEWEWYSDKNVSRVFIDLLLSVNFKPKQWQGIEIKRGQIVVGLTKYAKSLSLSTQELRTALKKLCKSGEINTQSTNKYTIITICKFDTYQDSDLSINNQSTINQQSINNQSTNEQQQLNNVKNKRIKELKERERESKKEIDFLKEQLSQLKNQDLKENQKSSEKKGIHEFPDITAKKSYDIRDKRTIEHKKENRPFSHNESTARQTLDALFPSNNNDLKARYKEISGKLLTDNQIAHSKNSYISNLAKKDTLIMINHVLEFERRFLHWWIEKDLKYQGRAKSQNKASAPEIKDGIDLTYCPDKDEDLKQRYS